MENQPLNSETTNAEDLKLTADQQILVIETWNSRVQNPPSLKELVFLVFKVDKDARSAEARAIKSFLASRNCKVKTQAPLPPPPPPKKPEPLQLTEDDKQFIFTNILAGGQSCLSIAEDIFKKSLNNTSSETVLVKKYIDSLPLSARLKASDIDEVPVDEYTPPGTEIAVIRKINKYTNANIDQDKYKENEKTKLNIKALLGYINSHRFVQTINSYTSESDRTYFEASFVDFTWNKEDLTSEERDSYIILASEIIIQRDIHAQITKFSRLSDDFVSGEEGARLSMSLVEQISNLRKEYSECIKRQQSLMKSLDGIRSERMKGKIPSQETVLTLVEGVKDAKKRAKMIEFINLRKQQLSTECDRITNMSELKSQLYGISISDIINS